MVKAFSTCVGDGPFTTEMDEKEAKELREQANEFGAATGRPRRVGHFDAVASRYGAEVQGAHEIAITKLDCLSGRPTLLVCTHYEYKGKKRTDFPINTVLEQCRPIYREMPGWTEDITGVRKFEDLPKAARDYVQLIEASIGRRARYVSVGAHRSAMIVREPREHARRDQYRGINPSTGSTHVPCVGPQPTAMRPIAAGVEPDRSLQAVGDRERRGAASAQLAHRLRRQLAHHAQQLLGAE